MTYWTVLVLTIFVDGQQMQSRLLFPSMKACGDASAVIYRAVIVYDISIRNNLKELNEVTAILEKHAQRMVFSSRCKGTSNSIGNNSKDNSRANWPTFQRRGSQTF
jgi:hypothetical protein